MSRYNQMVREIIIPPYKDLRKGVDAANFERKTATARQRLNEAQEKSPEPRK